MTQIQTLRPVLPLPETRRSFQVHCRGERRTRSRQSTASLRPVVYRQAQLRYLGWTDNCFKAWWTRDRLAGCLQRIISGNSALLSFGARSSMHATPRSGGAATRAAARTRGSAASPVRHPSPATASSRLPRSSRGRPSGLRHHHVRPARNHNSPLRACPLRRRTPIGKPTLRIERSRRFVVG